MFMVLDDGTKIKKCPVKPEHIDTSVKQMHFPDAFGNSETETSAWYIVLLCQEKGDWFPFTEELIESFYQGKGLFDGFTFNRLISDGWIVERENKYYITLQFVARVWATSPVI